MSRTFKATMLFQEGNYGWSESFYQTYPDTPNPWFPFVNNAVKLLRARCYCAARKVVVSGLRCSEEGVFRDSRFFPGGLRATDPAAGKLLMDGVDIPATGTTDTFDFSDEKATEQFTGLLLRMEAGVFHRRPFIMRGCPEAMIGDDNQYLRSFGRWRNMLAIFINVLTGFYPATPDITTKPWEIKGQPSPRTPPLPNDIPVLEINVTNSFPGAIEVVMDGLYPIETAMGSGIRIPVGGLVQLRGVKNSIGVNGFWTIQNAVSRAGPPITTLYTMSPVNRGISLQGGAVPTGRIRPYVATYTAIDRVADERFVSRRTGRPFGLPRGRRKR